MSGPSRRQFGVRMTAIAAAALVLAACGASSHAQSASAPGDPPSSSSRLVTSATGTETASRSDPSTSPSLSADSSAASRSAPADGRSAALRHLQWVLARNLHAAGPQTGALVVDMRTGAVLFAVRSAVGRPPASVEKLYTTVAADTLLGPNATFPTEVLGVGHLGPGGVWHGDLYLRGDGDPTFGDGTFNRLDEDGEGPTAAELVNQLRHAGIRRVAGRVIGDESRFDTVRGDELTNWAPDIPDYGGELSALVYDHGAVSGHMGPAVFAAHELVLTMRASGIRAVASSATGTTPPQAHLLATVYSPPLRMLLKLMDVPSDDLFADLLTKQLGYSLADAGTLAVGARQISHLIATRYGVEPTILDGSGLDRDDRSSPAQVVTLLRRVFSTRVGAMLRASLPVVGVDGTVRSIAVHTPAQGRCVAKTGTLDDITNLAGYCAAQGGDTIAFALFIDGRENWTALELISKMVAAIASY